MPPRPTPRDLGIPFDGEPGPYNAITDVPGVEVGHTTLIDGEGPLVIGQGPVRTGVTAILPLGRQNLGPVPAAWFPFNGNGEMTGTTWIEESGLLTGPILLTNTLSIGTVRDAVINWGRKKQEAAGTFNPNDYSSALALPVVAETWDGGLNDIYGFHVREEHVFHALDTATSGPVPQGNVGGGTGMVCYDFKGGIGTASRVVCMPSVGRPSQAVSRSAPPTSFTLGVLVQANHGTRSDLLIRGVPVGHELPLSEIPSYRDVRGSRDCPFLAGGTKGTVPFSSRGSSILIIIATDAPLLPHQLKRLARRATLGLARTGTIGNNTSGDLFLAFSTAAPTHHSPLTAHQLTNADMDPFFAATAEATEEAIVNALLAAETLQGRDHHTAQALPHARLQEIMRKYNRI